MYCVLLTIGERSGFDGSLPSFSSEGSSNVEDVLPSSKISDYWLAL